MTKRVIILAIFLVAVALLFDGRVPKKYCDLYLEVEWGRATSLRISDDNVPRRPTQEEAEQLRTAIGVCRPFTTRFDLVDPLSDDKVYGSISLITLAVELDDPDLLASLVAKGHPIDGLPNWLDMTTLYFATYRQASLSFHWLLENGADPSLTDSSGVSPLMMAAMHRPSEWSSVRVLIDAGADVNATDNEGLTALAAAIYASNLEDAALLTEAGADVGLARETLQSKARSITNEDTKNRVLGAIEAFDSAN